MKKLIFPFFRCIIIFLIKFCPFNFEFVINYSNLFIFSLFFHCSSYFYVFSLKNDALVQAGSKLGRLGSLLPLSNRSLCSLWKVCEIFGLKKFYAGWDSLPPLSWCALPFAFFKEIRCLWNPHVFVLSILFKTNVCVLKRIAKKSQTRLPIYRSKTRVKIVPNIGNDKGSLFDIDTNWWWFDWIIRNCT